MKLFKGLLVFLSVSMVLISCTTTSTMVTYDFGLTSVERPEDAQKRYGDYAITKKIEDEKGKYVYSDEMIESVWYVGPSTILFEIKNKTNSSIRIIWDEAAFVDETGNSTRVLNGEMSYANRNNPIPPSVIVRKGSFSNIIVPSDNLYFSSGVGVNILPIFKNEFSDPIEAEKFGKELVGKTIQVLLPLEIEGVTNDYIFVFKIDDYTAEEVTTSIWY